MFKILKIDYRECNEVHKKGGNAQEFSHLKTYLYGNNETSNIKRKKKETKKRKKIAKVLQYLLILQFRFNNWLGMPVRNIYVLKEILVFKGPGEKTKNMWFNNCLYNVSVKK